MAENEALAIWRLQLLARLAAERACLLGALWGLDAGTLTTSPVVEFWTAKDLLSHVAAWDAFHTNRMSMVRDGRIAELQEFSGEIDMDARNADLYRQYKDISLQAALALCFKERSSFLATLKRIPDTDLHRQIEMPWGEFATMRTWAEWRYRHDAIHAAHLQQWRQQLPQEIKAKRNGPKFILRALIRAARKEFVTTAALAPPAERTSRPVCGVWTLKDLVGHLTDWELFAVAGLRQLVAGGLPESEEITDFDVWNEAHAQARRSQPWSQVWQAFEASYQAFIELFDRLPEARFPQKFRAAWGPQMTVYGWVSIFARHEQQHTIDVRRALQIPDLPEYLLRL